MGNVVSIATSSIPGARYREFGEVKFLSIPANTPHHLVLDGYASGSFTLEIQEVENGEITDTTTFVAVPTSTTTTVTMDVIDGTIVNASPLRVDSDSNGTTDFSLTPKVGKLVYPDFTPPEALITFSTSTQSLLISGIDDLGFPVLVTATTTVTHDDENEENANDDDSELQTNATLTDISGNMLVIPSLKYSEKKHQTTLSFNTLLYNGSTTRVATTTLKYQWEVNKKGVYTMFSSTVTIGATTTVAKYNAKKNTTFITITQREGGEEKEDDDERSPRTTLSGMVIPSIITNKGSVEVRY